VVCLFYGKCSILEKKNPKKLYVVANDRPRKKQKVREKKRKKEKKIKIQFF